MNIFKQPNVRHQWIYIPQPKLNHYYILATSPVWRLIWVNRVGKVYRYDFANNDFIRDDIVEDLQLEWHYYAPIVLQETENLEIAKEKIKVEISRYDRKEFLELVWSPVSFMIALIQLFVVMPLNSQLRKIKKLLK